MHQNEKVCSWERMESEIHRYYAEGWDKRAMRLGQWLINTCAPVNTKAPEIFYEKEPDEALQKFINRYVIDKKNIIN